MNRLLARLSFVVALAWATTPASPLPESYGIARGWPMGPGAPPAVTVCANMNFGQPCALGMLGALF